jgi:hypothetical protein
VRDSALNLIGLGFQLAYLNLIGLGFQLAYLNLIGLGFQLFYRYGLFYWENKKLVCGLLDLQLEILKVG